jgi:DNA-directed RNA polymerase beta' subunit
VFPFKIINKTMEDEYDFNIDSIQFGILTPEEIKRMSTCEITSAKLPGPNTVYDIRMGPMNPKEICCTCGQRRDNCPGHFGHIVLHEPVAHPMYYKFILSFLKCVCLQCSRALITMDHLFLWGIHQKNEARFKRILDRIDKIKFCSHCNLFQPKYMFSTSDNIFTASYKHGGEVGAIEITVFEIQKIFDNISDDDVRLLGFKPEFIHPKHLIITVLPVIPPRSRPFIVTDNIICDDDLTTQYQEIVKTNNNLDPANDISDFKHKRYYQTLIFRIRTLYDNSQGRARHTNSRQIKGIKERIAGKDGLIRNNLMGKRVNFSARSVIGPDPTLRLYQIAVPPQIASALTMPEKVYQHNIESLQHLVVHADGANRVLRGKDRIDLRYALAGDKRLKFKLQEGDIVERKLRNGDLVVFNRQPTLHRGSAIAKEIVIREGKTIRMNLASTKTFNADFDGDEMNLHIPASVMSIAELSELSTTPNILISQQGSTPIVCIVQDALLASYLMTRSNYDFGKEVFYQICMKMDPLSFTLIHQKLETIQKIYDEQKVDIPIYSGKSVFSLLLPDDFIYHTSKVHIHNGVIYDGYISKADLGSRHRSIIRLLEKEYSKEVSVDFINNVQFVANEWMCWHGFSIGISDCIATKKKEIDRIVTKSFVEAEYIESTVADPFIREAKINMALSKAKDVGMRIAKDAFSMDNNFISTITSGSKGDFFNIAQITGLLGQQNLLGKRVQPSLNRGKRTLHHYPFKSMNTFTEYESKGFVKNSFFHGLNPREFWFHAMSGREGITDTAMRTAQSGYVQRKMVKIMEDVQVKYDQTVRNSVKSIIQFAYGDNNMSGCKSVVLDGEEHICDIGRLAAKLNLQHELSQ